MAERIYNGMIPLLADMVSATAGNMVEAGVDMWNPAQTVNDVVAVKKKFGDRLVLNGAMDEPWTNDKNASEEKLRAFVRDKVNVLGKNGGFYANSSTFNGHNKAIMSDELRKYGRHFYQQL